MPDRLVGCITSALLVVSSYTIKEIFNIFCSTSGQQLLNKGDFQYGRWQHIDITHELLSSSGIKMMYSLENLKLMKLILIDGKQLKYNT